MVFFIGFEKDVGYILKCMQKNQNIFRKIIWLIIEGPAINVTTISFNKPMNFFLEKSLVALAFIVYTEVART